MLRAAKRKFSLASSQQPIRLENTVLVYQTSVCSVAGHKNHPHVIYAKIMAWPDLKYKKAVLRHAMWSVCF